VAETPDGDISLAPAKKIGVLCLLIAAGLAGNYFRFPIFYSIDFLFGGIFALLALQICGFGSGVLAAFVISLSTYFLWNHPYAIFIMTAEVAFVGALVRRKKFSLIFADGLYWICVGMPLVFLFYHGVMRLTFENTLPIMLKQPLNGITAAMIARFAFIAVTRRTGKRLVSMREILFNLLTVFVLVPALSLLAFESRGDYIDMDRNIRGSMAYARQRTTENIDRWLNKNMVHLKHLATLASDLPAGSLQKYLDQTRREDGDFVHVGLVDRNARTIAFSPLVDELGEKTIGKDLSGRPFIADLKRLKTPQLSNVMMSRIGNTKPIVTMSAPVLRRGVYDGFITAMLETRTIADLIHQNAQAQNLPKIRFILLDSHDRVIVTDRDDLKPMEPFALGPGDIIRNDDGIIQWLPASRRNIAAYDRWVRSRYIAECRLDAAPGWRVVLDLSIEPFQKRLYAKYTTQMAMILATLLIALVISEITSKNMVTSLTALAEISSGLPRKLADSKEIAWPHSALAEPAMLIKNLREMSWIMADQYHDMRYLNAELENRIRDRTNELKEAMDYIGTIIKVAPVGILAYRATGECISANEAAAGIVGTTRENLLAQNFRQLASWKSSGFIEAADRALASGKTQHLDTDTVTSYGKTFTFSGHFVPFRFGGQDHVLLISEDISERAHKDATIRDLLLMHKTILNTLTVGVAYLKDRKIQWSNRAAEEMFGYEGREMIDRDSVLLYENQEDYDRVGSDGYHALIRGDSYATEVRMKKKNGTVFWCNLVGRAVDIENPSAGSIWMLLDIDERRHAEMELKSREAQLAESQRIARVGSWERTLSGDSVIWSEELFHILGMNPRTDTASFPALLAMIHPEDRVGMMNAIRESVTLNKPYSVDFRLTTRDGRKMVMHAQGEIVRDATGRPYVLRGTAQDITERKEIEAAVQENEQKLRAIFDTADDGIFILDLEGNFIDINRAAHERLGYTRDELLAKKVGDIRSPKFTTLLSKRMQELKDKGHLFFESEHMRKNGTAMPVEINGKMLQYGGRDVVLCVVRDITLRKRAAEALQKSEELYRSLVDSMAEGVTFQLADGTITAVNPAAEIIEGRTADQMLRRTLDDSQSGAIREDGSPFPGDAHPSVLALRTGHPQKDVIMGIHRPDGELRWISINAQPLVLSEGDAPYAVVTTFHDITDRKNAEDRLKLLANDLMNLTQNLERRVDEEIGLRMKNEQMLVQQSKLAAMGEMLGAIAHQWRQPLNALGLIIQNLRDAHEFGDLNKEYVEKTVQKSMVQIQHMSKTIDDFRNFFQPDKDKSVFDTMEAVGVVLSLLSAQLAAHGIFFTLTCRAHNNVFSNTIDIVPCPEKTVTGYRNEFEHVILNLINNAQEAILDRRSRGDRMQGRIDFDFEGMNDRVVIRVSDNGGGIAQAALDRIFEPYFTTKDASRGTGLGLYISKVIIEDHMCGKLTAANGDDGAIFTLEIPKFL
jgi:PAS domain S-box-containing protein